MTEPVREPTRPAPGWSPPPLSGTRPAAPPPAPGSAPPPALWAPPSGTWPPPTGSGTPPADGYSPARGLPGPTNRSTRWRVGLLVAVVALCLVGGLVALWLQFSPTQTPPTAAPVPTAPVEVEGGQLGRPVTLTGADGEAKVTVGSAHWTPEGDLPPQAGTSYLVLEVSIEGVSGQVAVGGIFTVAISSDGQRHAISYGPRLDDLLRSTVVGSGDTVSGQLGYQLVPGPTTIEFQDPAGGVLGTVEVPAP